MVKNFINEHNLYIHSCELNIIVFVRKTKMQFLKLILSLIFFLYSFSEFISCKEPSAASSVSHYAIDYLEKFDYLKELKTDQHHSSEAIRKALKISKIIFAQRNWIR